MSTYIVIASGDLGSVDFSQVNQTSSSTVRKNNDAAYVILSYRGSEPASLSGISKITLDSRDSHTIVQIKALAIWRSGDSNGWASAED